MSDISTSPTLQSGLAADSSATSLKRPTKSRYWADLTSRDFASIDMSEVVAVLPLGATEQHGPHLPLNVDSSLVDAIIARSMALLPDGLPVLYLPTQALGRSVEHLGFPGTLSLSASTVIALWTDIGHSLASTGVRKLIFFNGHGGNVSLMDIVGRDLRHALGLMVWSVNWFDLGIPSSIIDGAEMRFGVHGGQLETSVMQAIRPDQVRMEHAQRFESLRERHASTYPVIGDGKSARLSWMMRDLNPLGAAGNAAAADATQGKAILDAVIPRWVELLCEVQRVPFGELRPPDMRPDDRPI